MGAAGGPNWGSVREFLPARLLLTLCQCLLTHRETNMKVRQAIPVTSELGDTSKLALFDGECLKAARCDGAARGCPPPSLGLGPPCSWRDQDCPCGAVPWLKMGLWGGCWEHWDGAGQVEKVC